MDRFDPSAYESFHYDDVTLEATGVVSCHYSLRGPGRSLTFTEVFDLGPLPEGFLTSRRGSALLRVVRLLHLAAGLSYYKVAAPLEVVVEEGLTHDELIWLEGLYRQGLGEFAYVNDIDLFDRPTLLAAYVPDPAPLTGLDLPRRSLVAVGGGKDSDVTIDVLTGAGEFPLLFNVGSSRSAQDTAKVSGLELVTVSRKLDPSLSDLNAAGAFNGHVPVTAIVSLVALATALVVGADRVVFSNERSANVPNLVANGLPVNHQYSKGFEAESQLRTVLLGVSAELSYFSLLRPLSELTIARLFAASGRFMEVFTSCNAAFKIDASRRVDRWCGHCPKCRFVFLALAPFTSRDALVGVLGFDLLDDPSQLLGYRELLGLVGHRPFECVGEEDESRAALTLLFGDPSWQDSSLVPLLFAELEEAGLTPTPAGVGQVLAASGPHHLPADAVAALESALRSLSPLPMEVPS